MAFSTPDLPYAYNALEPYVDEATMRVHHDKHHVTYTTNLNNAIAGTPFETWSATDLVRRLPELPESIRTIVQNHGGGHLNHNLFWDVIGPKAGGQPQGHLAKAIDASFGSFDGFVKSFTDSAVKRFGSGWAWLVTDSQGRVSVSSSANQDNPLTQGLTPILGIDVWEHAYYLKYQNRRAEYVENFFHVINWTRVASLYEATR